MKSVFALINRLASIVGVVWVKVRPRSKIARLLGAAAALVATLAILVLGLTRLLGPRERFTTFTLPYVQDFKEVDVKHWFTQNGLWAIRNEALAQTANPAVTPETAADKAAQIFIPHKLGPNEPYHLSVYVTVTKNSREAGINFNAQYPKLTQQLHRVTIVRKDNGGMELSAGYTDKEGKFVPQVTVPFESTAQNYRLDLYVSLRTYLVQINGQTLIEKRPLFYPSGLVGFYALGPATFDTLKLTAAETEQPVEQFYVSDFDQPPGGAGWVPFRGEWRISAGELIQANPVEQDAGMSYEGSAFENYVLQATFHHLIGVGGGILFNMPSPYQLKGAHLVRYSDQADSLFWGYFDDKGVFTRQGFAEVPAPGADPHELRVFCGNTTGSYDIYLDDRLITRGVSLKAVTPISGTTIAPGHIGLITSRSSVAYTLVEVFPLFEQPPSIVVKPTVPPTATVSRPGSAAPTRTPASTAVAPTPTRTPTGAAKTPTPTRTPADAAKAPTLTPKPGATSVGATGIALQSNSRIIVAGSATPLQSNFSGDISRSDWRPIGGVWRFQDNALVQGDAAGFDLGIVYVRNAFRNYTFETSLKHLEGNGGGVLFNMPFADRLNGAHMVRYSDRRPGGVFWGYYDLSGKFVGQGYANVEPPETAKHIVRVVCGDATYNIYLDATPLAENVPFQATSGGAAQNFGYIGLITVQSTVSYDSVRISGAAATTATQPQVKTPTATLGGQSGFTDQRVLNGEWTTDQGVYYQSVPNPADYLLSTGISAANYTLDADVTLPDKPEAGGGFTFHMPDQGRKNGAFMIRLAKGGGVIMWGTYDEAGAFQGRSSVELPQNESGKYQLKIVVRGNRMDAFVDAQQVAKDVTLPRTEGWIALLAYGGPVTLQNVIFTAGPVQ